MTSHNRKSDKAIFTEKVQAEIKNARLHFKAGTNWPRLSNGERESIEAGNAALDRAYEMLENEAKPKRARVKRVKG
jgi:hypothetical protein